MSMSGMSGSMSMGMSGSASAMSTTGAMETGESSATSTGGSAAASSGAAAVVGLPVDGRWAGVLPAVAAVIGGAVLGAVGIL